MSVARHRSVRALLSFVILLLCCGCMPRYVQNWPLLSAGLTRGQVRAILGAPDLVMTSRANGAEITYSSGAASSSATPTTSPSSQPTTQLAAARSRLPSSFMRAAMTPESWQYGLSFFDFADFDKAYVVYFDESGRLESWAAPQKK
jgi:hypothetical protein